MLGFLEGFVPPVYRKKTRRQRLPPGSAPGQMRIDPTALRTKVTVTRYAADFIEEREVTRKEELLEEKGKPGVLWVEARGLGDGEMLHAIQEVFDLHRLAMEDVVNTDQRAKVEDYKQCLYLVLHCVSPEGGFQQYSTFLAGNAVIVVQETHEPAFAPLHERLRGKVGLLRQMGADFLLYAVVDALVDSYYSTVDQFGVRLEQYELMVLRGLYKDPVTLVHGIKQELLEVRRNLWQSRDALYSLRQDYPAVVSQEVRVYLRDSYDHVVEMLDRVELYRESARNLMDLHFNNVNSQQNEVMKVLTIVGAIFIPLNFIAALYGMNFNPSVSPLNMPETEWYYGYPYVLSLMLAVVMGLLVFFWWRGWIGRRKYK